MLASVVGLSQLIVSEHNPNNTLTVILSERLFSLHPSANGFFHISRFSSNPQASTDSLTSTTVPALPVNMNLTGENALININLEPNTNK